MTDNKNQPDYISPAVAAMRAASEVCRVLYGGTVAMRNAGRAYLPQWPQEADKAWESRRDCSVLFPALKKAVGVMIGKPLGSTIGIGEDVPATVEVLLDDVDRQGRDLDNFARSVGISAMRDGITWVLADHTKVPPGATLAVERQLGARPYLIHIPLWAMLGWRFIDGKLAQLRYAETVEEADGRFAMAAKTRVREWLKDPETGAISVNVWAKTAAGGDWVVLETIPVAKMQEIPIEAIYGEHTGLWSALPPMEDLAWLNVQHWQSASDQRNVLHVARVPILAADEDVRDDKEAPVSVKANGIITGLKGLGYVEHSGAAIGAGRQDLLDIEDQMRRVAGELLSRVTQKTATEASLESTEGESWLRSWARNFEGSLARCLGWMAKWTGEQSGGTVSLDFEWDDATLAAEMLTALTNARTAGEISRETYLTKLKDGKILPPGRTVEQEMDALDQEGPKAFPGVANP